MKFSKPNSIKTRIISYILPLELEKIKKYLRISSNYDDDILINLQKLAIIRAEKYTGQFINPNQVTIYYHNQLYKNAIDLDYLPLLEFKSIKVHYMDGRIDNICESQYSVDNNILYLYSDIIAPEIVINYIAGYKNSEEIPSALLEIIKIDIANLYTNKNDINYNSNDIIKLYQPFRSIKL